MRNCANKRKWYQPSYNMEYYQQETQAGRHVGIPHEKAEKHASFFIISSLNLWLSNEIRNAVWAKRVHWVIEKTCVRAFELRTPTFLSDSSFFREERWMEKVSIKKGITGQPVILFFVKTRKPNWRWLLLGRSDWCSDSTVRRWDEARCWCYTEYLRQGWSLLLFRYQPWLCCYRS